MERQVLGRVRGSMWYSGDGITGTSTTPAVFAGSGVEKAYVNDLYLNTHATSQDRGNVYACVTKGDALTAEWVYAGSIRGPLPDVIDNLNSSSRAYALSANMGRELKELMDGAGIYAKTVIPRSAQETYTAALVIENKDSVITFTDAEGNEGTYDFTAGEGTADRTITLTIGDMFAAGGVRIVSITSTEAAIKAYTLYDSGGVAFYAETPSIWEHIAEIENGKKIVGDVTDGEQSFPVVQMSMMLDGERVFIVAESHAKAVWFSKEGQKTVFDILEEMLAYGAMIDSNHFYASIADEDGDIIIDDDGEVIAGDWRYNI